jgi:hypothetical protein
LELGRASKEASKKESKKEEHPNFPKTKNKTLKTKPSSLFIYHYDLLVDDNKVGF